MPKFNNSYIISRLTYGSPILQKYPVHGTIVLWNFFRTGTIVTFTNHTLVPATQYFFQLNSVLSVSEGKQQCKTPYNVQLRDDDSLNQETQVLSTTCVSGHFCKLELAELFVFSPIQKSYHNLFSKQRIITFR